MLEYLDSVDAVKQWLLSFGGWTPFIYFLFQILQVIIAPIPGGTTTLVGGALFGWIKGFLLSEAGIMIGTAAAFGIAKKLGRPRVFLMDEPLSNLDAKLRTQMRFELVEMYKKVKNTFLYVTHDQVEAMSMGTYIVVMNQGEIMQKGTPKEIYTNPANLFVAQFIGAPPTNIIDMNHFYLGVRPRKNG